jgi:hypothetical protein
MEQLVEQTTPHYREKFIIVPRGFLKGLVDMLDELE